MTPGDIVVGRVRSEITNGAIVDIGRDAFLPATETPQDISRLAGQLLHFEILDMPDDAPIVVRHFCFQPQMSREEILAGGHYTPKLPINKFQVGQRCIGIVRNVASFGVFVDLGKMDALLLFNGQNADAKALVVDQIVDVIIQKLEIEKEKIHVSLATA